MTKLDGTPPAPDQSEDAEDPQTSVARRLREAEIEEDRAARRLEAVRLKALESRRENRRLQSELDETKEALAKIDKAGIRPVAAPARMRKRHYGMLVSFALFVLLPVGLSGAYLYTRAAEQYASTMAFTVRSEDVKSSAADLLGGLGAGIAGVSSGEVGKDSDILYEFMQSPDIVRRIDDLLDLRSMFSRTHESDPIFAFAPDGTIEDLTDYWRRMVQINYDTVSHLMQVRVLAFSPEDARSIAENVFSESSRMINELSDIAREDKTRYAQEDLDTALERLKLAREAVTQFRLQNQIVDVQADIASQMGLLAGLQTQQTEAMIELDLLSDSARPGDPRLDQAQRRLAVIEGRIAEERAKFGSGVAGDENSSYGNKVSEYERIAVDREFAERTYVSALSAFDTAKAEANRQSRYLAAYITPTLAQKAEYPQRGKIVAGITLFALLLWIVGSLIYYALRERR